MNHPAFDAKMVKMLSAQTTPGILFAIGLDEPGRIVCGAGMEGTVYALDLSQEKPAPQKKWDLHDNYVSGLLLKDGQFISAGYDRRLAWTDVKTGARVRVVQAHDGWVRR